MYTWIQLNSNADLAQLKTHISNEYNPGRVAEKLAEDISGAVKGILIERNYIDKDYRSTFYNFYSKKGQYYRPDCVRLHFFDETVRFEETRLRLVSSAGNLTYHYFGYMVLRPTGTATIGRSVVTPDVRRGACRYVITAKHKIHLLGYTLTVEGFPSMDQHCDIAVCAHVSCWSILRHYSERHTMYREFLTHDITMMAQEFDPGGLVPSKGLDTSQALRVFQEAETFPFHVARDMDNVDDPAFYRQLGAYVESGFPLFAAMNSRQHAVTIIGYEWREPVITGASGMRYSWDEIKCLAVVDDHYLPYRSIPVALPVPVADETLYSAEDIDEFLIVLPEKVFYPADAVDAMVPKIFSTLPIDGLPAEDEMIIRYFMTTGSGFRRFVRKKESEFDPVLFEKIVQLPLAQFVWVVEFATEAQWALGKISGRALIDATASAIEQWPLWLYHTCAEALVFARDSVSLATATVGGHIMPNAGNAGFSRMVQNLRPTITK